MEQLIQFLHQHPEVPVVALWMFSALVTTMPQPTVTERWYGWVYNFFQSIAANLDRVGKKSA